MTVLGAFGGRLDHEFSHYHVLYKYAHLDIVLLSPKRAAFLLAAGRHAVRGRHLGPNCGVVPLGEPARCVTTRGLKWDLDGREMSIMVGGWVWWEGGEARVCGGGGGRGDGHM